MFRKLLMALALLLPSAAHADWHEATSKHFIVYSEGSVESLRKAASDLEKYDFVLRFVSGAKPAVSPIKLKVYLVRDTAAVADMMPFGSSGVAGYYEGTARGPFAVGVRIGPGYGLGAQQILFHEYAHHFMHQNFPATYPTWYTEGFAEYYGTTKILENDVVEVGHSSQNRYYSFWGNRWLPLGKVLTARSYADVSELDLLYAEGWLLVHYLANNKARAGQLQRYLAAINAGQSYEAAMNSAFGEGARKLDSELRNYSNKSRINALRLPFKPIDVGEIRIRKLPPAEDALLEYEIALSSGVPAAAVARFAAKVRSVAARVPETPYSLGILTEAERLAGNNAAAAAAVERWLALSPRDARALMHKGELQIESLRAAKSQDQRSWDAARAHIFEAHKANPRDPLVLLAYYNSFVSQGVMPPPGAQNGLARAFELVPQDDELRYLLAADFEQRGMLPEAIAVIKPAAFQFHGRENESPAKKKRREQREEKYRVAGQQKRETPREMLDRLEKKLAEAGTKQAPAKSGS